MGWGKKKAEADGEESKRSRLFGGKKDKPASPAPSASNPYAAAPPSNGNPYASKSSNPYAAANGKSDPYAAPSQSSFSQPPSTSYSNSTLTSEPSNPPPYAAAPSFPNRYDKSAVPLGGYGGSGPRYPTGDGGQVSGYGSNPYGGAASSAQPSRGAGGYGGLGRSNSQETMGTDAGRSALFGDAAQRAQQNPSPAPQQAADPSYSNAGGYESTEIPGGYGGAPELTEEEQEEQEVAAIKGETKEIKREDVQRLRNARRIAEQAEMTGRDTLARLGGQGDRIHNTERNLDMASNHNRLAEEKARELRTLNRSMWAVHVSNPFTKESRRRAGEEIALNKHQEERKLRDDTTQAAISSSTRHQQQSRDLNGNIIRQNNAKTLADRSKYQFEADSEDDELEDEIDESLEVLRRGATQINKISTAMGNEITHQNERLDLITNKTDKVDDQIALNRHRLQNISPNPPLYQRNTFHPQHLNVVSKTSRQHSPCRQDPRRQLEASLTRLVNDNPPAKCALRGGLFHGPVSVAYTFLVLQQLYPDLVIEDHGLGTWSSAYLKYAQDHIQSYPGPRIGKCGIMDDIMCLLAIGAASSKDKDMAANLCDYSAEVLDPGSENEFL
ncbi:hypothetical protein KC351_g710 [Hortaea werneckii]|nr:hypothetical protein KC351_g710 [Hortaea werneckii]